MYRQLTHRCVRRTRTTPKSTNQVIGQLTCMPFQAEARITHRLRGQDVKKKLYLPVCAQTSDSFSKSNSSPRVYYALVTVVQSG